MDHTTQTATKRNPPHPQPTDKPKNNTDSKTKADLRLHGGRDRITVRVKPELKEALSEEYCRRDAHVNPADFIRDAIREKIEKDAPELYRRLFKEAPKE